MKCIFDHSCLDVDWMDALVLCCGLAGWLQGQVHVGGAQDEAPR